MAHQAKLPTGSPQPRTEEPSRGLRVVHRRVNRELRGQLAGVFDRVLSALVADGNAWASNRAIASKLGVDESVVRDIRAGDSPLSLDRLVEMVGPEHAATVLEQYAQELRNGGGGGGITPNLANVVATLNKATGRIVTGVLESAPPSDLEGAVLTASKASAQLLFLLTRKEGK